MATEFEELAQQAVMIIYSLLGILALYVIARILINHSKGKDGLDGLL
jgi:hypothetical protein